MQQFDRGRLYPGFIGSDRPESTVDEPGCYVPYLKRNGLPDQDRNRGTGVLSREEAGKALDEIRIRLAIQVGNHPFARGIPFLPPVCEQSVQCAGLIGRQCVQVHRRLFLEDVQVTHCAQSSAGLFESPEVGLDRLGRKVGAEDAKGGPHPPGGDTHVVKLLNILAPAGAGLVSQHPRKVQTQRYAACCAHRVTRPDSGGLSFHTGIRGRRWNVAPFQHPQATLELGQGDGAQLPVRLEGPRNLSQLCLTPGRKQFHLQFKDRFGSVIDLIQAQFNQRAVPVAQGTDMPGLAHSEEDLKRLVLDGLLHQLSWRAGCPAAHVERIPGWVQEYLMFMAAPDGRGRLT